MELMTIMMKLLLLMMMMMMRMRMRMRMRKLAVKKVAGKGVAVRAVAKFSAYARSKR